MAAGTFQDRLTTEIEEGDVVTITRSPVPDPEEEGETDFCVTLTRLNEQFGGPSGALTKSRRITDVSLTPGALAKAIEHCSWGITDAIDTIMAAQE